MKKGIITLALSILTYCLPAQNMSWDWAIQGGGTSWDHGYSIATDSENNVIIRGKFVNTGYFGDTSFVALGPEEDYLAKYTQEGKLIWARKLAGKASWEKDRSLAIDENNNIYLAGWYNTAYQFDHISLTPLGGYDGYITKLNKDGEYQWAYTLGGKGTDAAYAISYSENKLFVTGFFSDTANFTSGDLVSNGSADVFISCYNMDGKNEWTIGGGGVNDDRGFGIASDDNFFYLTARISGNADFNGFNLNCIGPNDMVLAKYDLNGALIWVKNDAGTGEIESKTIATSEGNIYITGRFSGSAKFGSLMLNSVGQSDTYIAKYNEKGNVEWIDMHSGLFANEGNSIVIKNSRVYMVGVFGSEISIGDTSLVCNASRDAYVCCYNTRGDFIWATDFGAQSGSNHVLGNTIAVDNKGAIYVAGEYSGGASLGGSDLKPIGSFDMFLVKLIDLKIPSSISNLTQTSKMTIYPNPNNGIFNIEVNQLNSSGISIFDHSGSLLFQKDVYDGEQINIAHFPKGIYFLKNESMLGHVCKVLYLKD